MTPQDFPFLKEKFVMVDLETLSKNYNATIVSIGAVKFTFDKGIIDEFKVNIDPKSCREYGLHVDPDTIDWWKQQSKEAIKSWTENPTDLDSAITQFVEWWGTRKDLIFCCNGMSFDAPILYSAFKALGRANDIPWHYRNEFDLRTIYKLFGVSTNHFKGKDSTIVFHDALEDCKFQTHNLMKLFDYEPF